VAPNRRNRITRTDSVVITVIAAISGAIAVTAGCEPTGNTVPDVLLTVGLATLVTWLAASSPWWALLSAAAVVALAAVPGSFAVLAVAWVAMVASVVIGLWRLNQPGLRAGIGAVIVQVVLRLDWDPFFLAPAIVGGVAMILVGVSGWRRRRGDVRARVMWGAVAVVAIAGLATLAFALNALRFRSDATDGYHAMLRALEQLESGEMEEAAGALAESSSQLGAAGDGMGGWLSQPARAVPVVAQNRDITVDLMNRAADAADSASDALATVDLDRLQIVDGRIDVEALRDLEPALAELERTVLDLQDVLDEAQSPYLVGPLESRIDRAHERADQVAVQAVASHAASQVGPALLGADGPRRYLIAFTNPAESRGQSGLMGNWTEVTITDGAIEITDSGRTAELERGIDDTPPFELDMPEEYLTHYGSYGAGGGGEPVDRKYWGNAFISPDLPSVGSVLAQMYETTRDRELDGVIVMDPTAIAGLLNVTGPIDVPGTDIRLTGENAVEFLTRGQYEYAENEREDFLEAVTEATVEQVLSSTLPPPQTLGAALGPAATEGHLSAWAFRPEEQRLLELVGMEDAMPRLDDLPQRDALAVTSNNSSGNKIDSFLEREITYRPTVDEDLGIVVADLEVVLTNTAPSVGYPDYVIGNIVDLPTGTNRNFVELWSALDFDSVEVDGEPVPYALYGELGYQIQTVLVDIPPGESVTIRASLAGEISPGDYELIYRPQPLPNPDHVVIDARRNGDGQIFGVDGEVLRRTLFTADSSDAWRPDDHPAR
jgi:hypothetical protein